MKRAGIGGWGEQSDLLVRLSASSSVTWPPKTTFLIASDGCAEGSEASSVGQSGKMQRLVEGRVRRKAKTGSASYLTGAARRRRRGGGGALALGLRPREQVGRGGVGAPHRRRPVHLLLLLPVRTAPLPLSRRFVAFSL